MGPATVTVTATLKKMYIDGQWCAAKDGKTVGVINPATEDVICDMAFGSRADVKRAIESASKAMVSWMKLTPYDRAKVLKKTADLMRERADAIARTLTMEQGKPLAEAKAEVLHSADTFEWFAEEGKRAYGQLIPNSIPGKKHVTLKHPVGVVAAISPWNFPITLQSRKIAPALAAGCTIVCKPASQTPLSLVQVFECMIDAGLPPGVANLVLGPMFEKRAMENTLGLVDDARKCGAKILTGGKRSDKFPKGYFFEPTVLTNVPPQTKMLTEEPFAPVMPLLDFSKLDDVIRAANNTRYGLAAYVFTNDLTVAWKMAEGLEAGIIGVNDPVPATPQCPFGGMKESGLGRELGHEGLEAYLETKYVSFRLRDS